ncbi:MAG: chloride channel protein [Hyphomicrobiales bacterium]|nr:chloride channel protein [Hyphomicrobiales bacterium]
MRLARRGLAAHAVGWAAPNIRAALTRRDGIVWLIAIAVGLAAAGGAIAFRVAIAMTQVPWLGGASEAVASMARTRPWWVILLAPAAGGLLVGLALGYLMPGRRAESVADVIEAQAVGGSRIPLRRGLISAGIAAVSLGSGASAGREGPVVHLGASLASALSARFHLPPGGRRTILACGVAGAVAASFNVPIAGALFAHEVILGHYALSAFVPIVISSVGASVVSRLYFGDFPAFTVPSYHIASLWEFPAFALLGLTCALVAILFQFAIMGTDWIARKVPLRLWLRPVVGGLLVGAIAIFFPEILGVGYEATDMALNQQLPLMMLIALIVAKTAATAITLGSRFGGGVFSPSLYLGAMTGGAFGYIAAAAFPEIASSHGLYAILGMGAVTAAVLGAPISTTMIVFELTGGLALSIALLLTVSVASAATQLIHGRSYFHWQLAMRGLFLREGPHKRLGRLLRVKDFMQPMGEGEAITAFDAASGEPWLTPAETIETALRVFAAEGVSKVPVVDESDESRIVGWAFHVDALAVFNEALIDASIEEHR